MTILPVGLRPPGGPRGQNPKNKKKVRALKEAGAQWRPHAAFVCLVKKNKSAEQFVSGRAHNLVISLPGRSVIILPGILCKKNGHETDLEMSPRPLGSTVFEEI